MHLLPFGLFWSAGIPTMYKALTTIEDILMTVGVCITCNIRDTGRSGHTDKISIHGSTVDTDIKTRTSE